MYSCILTKNMSWNVQEAKVHALVYNVVRIGYK